MSDQAVCAQCGEVHSRTSLELSFKRPDSVFDLPDAQRKAEVRESDDLCTINDDRFFIRGVIPLRVEEWEKPYRIGVWVEVERMVFDRVRELWDDPEQGKEPSFPARLANEIRSLPSTNGTVVNLQLTGATSRPDVLVPGSEHPLHREQCLGISAHRAGEYSSFFK
jgi:hypothetical protein